ncbi:MAG: hypothetical protein AVDCRST_MAG95-3267, partial [uncultured Adhaeribacter sp.]
VIRYPSLYKNKGYGYPGLYIKKSDQTSNNSKGYIYCLPIEYL